MEHRLVNGNTDDHQGRHEADHERRRDAALSEREVVGQAQTPARAELTWQDRDNAALP
jgi:hypothetical protein